MSNGKKDLVAVRIEPALTKKIEKLREKLAKRNNGMTVTVSDIVRMALEKFVESQP